MKEYCEKIAAPEYRDMLINLLYYDGTGLGLPMAKELAELLGGYITFESKVNVGTKFVIHLLFEIDRDTQKRKMNEIPEDISIEGIRILLVEDNELNMEIADCLLIDDCETH